MASAHKNIVILISGSGSNMAAIARAADKEDWRGKWGVQVAAVISNRADAPGWNWPQSLGIATAVVPHKAFDSREAFDAELMARIDDPRAGAGGAGRFHAHPDARLCAALRGAAHQHPPFAAAGLHRPQHAPARD
jgi:hypothetical protein